MSGVSNGSAGHHAGADDDDAASTIAESAGKEISPRLTESELEEGGGGGGGGGEPENHRNGGGGDCAAAAAAAAAAETRGADDSCVSGGSGGDGGVVCEEGVAGGGGIASDDGGPAAAAAAAVVAQKSCAHEHGSNGVAQSSAPPSPSPSLVMMPPPPPKSISTTSDDAAEAARKPVLADWMKDGAMDDSDADTANSLLGGAPSSRGSMFACAAPAAGAGGVMGAAVVDPAGGGTDEPSGPDTGTEGSTAAEPEVTGESPSSKLETMDETGSAEKGAPGVGLGGVAMSGARKLANWIRGTGADDSDADTNTSGRTPLRGSKFFHPDVGDATSVAADALADEAAAAAIDDGINGEKAHEPSQVTPPTAATSVLGSGTGGAAGDGGVGDVDAGDGDGDGDGDGATAGGGALECDDAGAGAGAGDEVGDGIVGNGGGSADNGTKVAPAPGTTSAAAAAGAAGAGVSGAIESAKEDKSSGAAAKGVVCSKRERAKKLEALFDGGDGGESSDCMKKKVAGLPRSISADGRVRSRLGAWGRGSHEHQASGQSDDQTPSSPPRTSVRAISDTINTGGKGGHGSGGGGGGGSSTERRRHKESGFLPTGNLRPRRSLSIGGLKGMNGGVSKFEVKGSREAPGWLSDGEDAEELSPIGHEIAYMKQQRGTLNKTDKSTGGLGSRGTWTNKSKKDSDAAKVIYLGDIDFDAPGQAATDILVRQHRTRVRVKRVKDRGTGRKKRRTKPKRRIRSGKPLHPEEDEVEYILTIGMMLGLRVAVGRQASPLAKQELTVEDFYQVDKYTFPPSGATGYLVTPSHKLGRTFKFKDYAPKVFKKIREHFGVDKMRYMLSVAGNYNFLEFISNAKSGEFFFFSHDERFMIKTMKSSETKFLRRILPHYYEHVKVHPETFLVRFYGMYRVKMHHLNKKVHFIVMNSVLDTYKEIHNTYDLKGSSLGRDAKPGEKVLKDNDLSDRQGKLHLGSQREAFLKVVRADTEFLARMKIMDYSLLTGIHDRAKPAEEEQPQSPRRYSRFFNFADEAENKTTPGFKLTPVALPRSHRGSIPPPPRVGFNTASTNDGCDDAASGIGGDSKLSPGVPGGANDAGDGAGAAGAAGGGGAAGGEKIASALSPAAPCGEEDGGEGAAGAGGSASSPGLEPRLPDAPSSAVSGRTFSSDQAELMFDNATNARNSLDARRKRSAVLEGITEAAAAGELYPFSAEEEEGADIYSDEEAAGGGLWSGPGTGTEGEGEATDTAGDYTEGDIEYETGAENDIMGEGKDPKASLSRCSTAKGSLAQLPDPFLSSQEASAVVAAAAAAAAKAAAKAAGDGGRGGRKETGKGSGVLQASAGRSWMGRARMQTSKPRAKQAEPRLAPAETRVSCVIKRRLDGGLDSEVDGKRGRDIYFMGIIDILQEYNARKHGETFLKSLAHDRAEISCVDPAMYCQRFNDFLDRHTD